ncbi:hypothetical protein ACIPWI_21220 [Streptomyces sp. NPDC090046]|uniref:hypothetical protein n=1 Tax=Streptomyces sp. NPDC090046 TaxID=3365928 RepID=UPI0037FB0753
MPTLAGAREPVPREPVPREPVPREPVPREPVPRERGDSPLFRRTNRVLTAVWGGEVHRPEHVRAPAQAAERAA